MNKEELQAEYDRCLAIGGLTLADATQPTSQLKPFDLAHIKWAQQYVLDKARNIPPQPPPHWHPAFRKEKMTKAESDAAWAAPIPKRHLDKVMGPIPQEYL